MRRIRRAANKETVQRKQSTPTSDLAHISLSFSAFCILVIQSSFLVKKQKVILDTGLGGERGGGEEKTWWENSNLPDTHSSFSPRKQKLLWQEGCHAENKCVFVIIRISPLAKKHTDPATKGFKFPNGYGYTELSLLYSQNFDILSGIHFMDCLTRVQRDCCCDASVPSDACPEYAVRIVALFIHTDSRTTKILGALCFTAGNQILPHLPWIFP